MENASKALIIAGAILIAILLITIGIILINSGRNVVDTGVATMSSQAIQAFNGQFTPYEGEISGRQIRNLRDVAKASNATNIDHQVYVIYEPEYSWTSIRVRPAWTSLGYELIEDTKTYKVGMHYIKEDSPYNIGARVDANSMAALVRPNENWNYENGEAGYIDFIWIRDINVSYPYNF